MFNYVHLLHFSLSFCLTLSMPSVAGGHVYLYFPSWQVFRCLLTIGFQEYRPLAKTKKSWSRLDLWPCSVRWKVRVAWRMLERKVSPLCHVVLKSMQMLCGGLCPRVLLYSCINFYLLLELVTDLARSLSPRPRPRPPHVFCLVSPHTFPSIHPSTRKPPCDFLKVLLRVIRASCLFTSLKTFFCTYFSVLSYPCPTPVLPVVPTHSYICFIASLVLSWDDFLPLSHSGVNVRSCSWKTEVGARP